MNAPNPLETLAKGLSFEGASVEFKQRLPDGRLEDTNEKHLSLLNTRANVATLAHALQNLSQEERNMWAIKTKDQGNELYRAQEFGKALEKYIECLTASNFGDFSPKIEKGTSLKVLCGGTRRDNECDAPSSSQSSSDNVDAVIMPVLCNMAACCIQLKAWGKVVMFCNQALDLRQRCPKALMRKGIALFHLGEFKDSIGALSDAITSNDHISSITKTSSLTECPYATISLADQERVKIYLERAKVKSAVEKRQDEKTKKALQKIFSPPQIARDAPEQETLLPVKSASIIFYLGYIFQLVVQWFTAIITYISCGKHIEKRD